MNNRQNEIDPEIVLNEYSYNIVDETDYGKNIKTNVVSLREKSVINGEELKPVLNEIVLWKVDRIVDVDNESLLTVFNFCKEVCGPEDVLNREDETKKVVRSLLDAKKGIRIAMASTILHFFNENAFPIIDTRAYRTAYSDSSKKVPQGKNDDAVCTYIDYIRKCLGIFEKGLDGAKSLKKCGKSFKDVDKYLYQCDKNASNKIKQKQS